MRREFEMTEVQHARLLKACEPVRLIALQCGPISSPQESANAAWVALGRELGFEPMSVLPVSGKDDRFFTAEATTETP